MAVASAVGGRSREVLFNGYTISVLQIVWSLVAQHYEILITT